MFDHICFIIMQLTEFEAYKTKKCDQQHPLDNFSSLLIFCPYNHTRQDKRRIPFTPNKKEYAYSEIYVQDYYSTDMTSNMIEHLFHPQNYKTVKCKYRMNPDYSTNPKNIGTCPHQKYCPYLHDNEDVSYLSSIRNLSMKCPLQDSVPTFTAANQLKELLLEGRDKINPELKAQIEAFKEHLRSQSSILKKQNVPQLKIVPSKAQHQKIEIPSTAQIIKQSQAIPNKNWYSEYSYFQFGERLPIFQDRHHQFKNYRDIIKNDISATVVKYITAFLNSEGGVLYIGIDDSSNVYGLELKQGEYDKFLLAIDREGKFNVNPPLMPQKYSVRRVPVMHHKKNKDLYVIEIKVTPSESDQKNRTLTTYNRECFVRMSASTHKLDAMDLLEYIRVNEEHKNQQKDKAQILQDLYKSIDKKSSNISLQTLQDMKRVLTKLNDRIDALVVEKSKPNE